MDKTNQPTERLNEQDSIRFEQVAPDNQRQALAVLLTGRAANEDDPAVEQFIGFSQAQELSLDQLWAARSRGADQPRASVLIVPAAGRTAMMFLSPAKSHDDWLLTELVSRACAAQNPDQVVLIQCLLDPKQRWEDRILVQAGFSNLATLVYMDCAANLPAVPLDLSDHAIGVINWSPQARGAFGDAILASYRDTLDCPGLVGLRQIDDVIDGHMATGTFDPGNWFAFYARSEPVGVMLLSQAPHAHAYELVYMGIAPEFRGKGLARRLLRHGLGIAGAGGGTGETSGGTGGRMLLAVDEKNTPALRLYESLGFGATGRKRALIYSLS